MDCPGTESGFPSVVKFTSVMNLGRVLCLFLASYGAIFSFLCTVFICAAFVTSHKETRCEMLDENAEPFISHKRSTFFCAGIRWQEQVRRQPPIFHMWQYCHGENVRYDCACDFFYYPCLVVGVTAL